MNAQDAAEDYLASKDVYLTADAMITEADALEMMTVHEQNDLIKYISEGDYYAAVELMKNVYLRYGMDVVHVTGKDKEWQEEDAA